MSQPTYTPSMLASALMHYERRATWTRIVNSKTRIAYVVFEGSTNNPKTSKPWVYYTARDGSSCSCRGYEYHGRVCSHSIAVLMDVAQARRLAARRAPRHERADLSDVA